MRQRLRKPYSDILFFSINVAAANLPPPREIKVYLELAIRESIRRRHGAIDNCIIGASTCRAAVIECGRQQPIFSQSAMAII